VNIYGHVMPAMQQHAASEIDTALGDESASGGVSD